MWDYHKHEVNMMKALKKSLIKAEHLHKDFINYKLKDEIAYSSVTLTFKN